MTILVSLDLSTHHYVAMTIHAMSLPPPQYAVITSTQYPPYFAAGLPRGVARSPGPAPYGYQLEEGKHRRRHSKKKKEPEDDGTTTDEGLGDETVGHKRKRKVDGDGDETPPTDDNKAAGKGDERSDSDGTDTDAKKPDKAQHDEGYATGSDDAELSPPHHKRGHHKEHRHKHDGDGTGSDDPPQSHQIGRAHV